MRILFFTSRWPVSLSLISTLFTVLATCSAGPGPRPILEPVELHGHRGARGLVPENTLPAFAQAARFGMTTFELDLNLTADDKLILYHDNKLSSLCLTPKGTAPAPTPLRKLTVAQIQELDCGAVQNADFPEQKTMPGLKAPTIDEFFTYVSKRQKSEPAWQKITFNIELKFPPQPPAADVRMGAQLLAASIVRFNMVERSTVQSFHLPALPEVFKQNKNIRLSALFVPTYFQGFLMKIGLGGAVRSEIIAEAKKYGAHVISPYYLYANADFIHEAHAQKLAVIVWTVNDEDLMADLLSRGVDGIITDYPDRLQRVWQAHHQ